MFQLQDLLSKVISSFHLLPYSSPLLPSPSLLCPHPPKHYHYPLFCILPLISTQLPLPTRHASPPTRLKIKATFVRFRKRRQLLWEIAGFILLLRAYPHFILYFKYELVSELTKDMKTCMCSFQIHRIYFEKDDLFPFSFEGLWQFNAHLYCARSIFLKIYSNHTKKKLTNSFLTFHFDNAVINLFFVWLGIVVNAPLYKTVALVHQAMWGHSQRTPQG